jgi:hypothetical protein
MPKNIACSTQWDIAKKLGVDRSLISKVLNRDPNLFIGDRLRERIFEVAGKLGYDLERLHGKRRGPASTRSLEIPTRFEIRLLDNSVFAKGTANIVQLTATSVELADIQIKPAVLPLKPGFARLEFKLGGKPISLHADFDLIALVRFIRIRVKYADMDEENIKIIESYIHRTQSGGTR